MKTLYNFIVDCFRPRKVQPELTELDIFYNNVRLSRESTHIIHNSFKEKSEKLKSGKIN